ncbi:hypothetical protein FHS38_005273 [Streptomyces netropsis]|uniref:Uncharacterized protein n=1 Tax=Streptomyces netropsis TaxID=55404 RepID=A0A7W7LGG0_STRNE|nr:hypothetical protein [Streptomyces netropsis]GGR46672.1 hypothetical protein GCM10010219_60150 [Streptomyces netropsis]
MPELPSGARRRLKRKLHELHLKAGAPSVGTILREMPERYSRSVVHGVFASPVIQQRDQVVAVAEALVRRVRGGDAAKLLDEVYRQWEEAWTEEVHLAAASETPVWTVSYLDEAPRPQSRGANTRLADLFGLSGWTKGELARLVNRQAAVMGHPQLATDTARVRRWIDMGESPRDPVPKVLAALFTERLGRVVTIEDLGFARRGRGARTQSPDGLPWAPERTAAILTEFTGMDLMLNRRGLVGAGATLSTGSALGVTAVYDPLHAGGPAAGTAPGQEKQRACVVCGHPAADGLLHTPASRGGVCHPCARRLGHMAGPSA